MERFNLSRWAVAHPALVGFLIVLIFAAGGRTFARLGRAEDPNFTIKEMVVSAQWPGASPSQMRRQVAEPLEQVLHSTESINWLRTYCVEGACVTQITLQDSTAPQRLPAIWQKIRHKLTDIAPTLPSGVILAANDDYNDVYGYVFALTGSENAGLVKAAEALRDRLLRLKGVGKIQISGELPQRIYVDADPRQLATLGLSIGQLAKALGQASTVSPSGMMEQSLSVPLRISGAPDGAAAVEATRLPLAHGASLRVGDVAQVARGYADPAPSLIRYGGKPAVVLSVAMAPDADGLAFGAALRGTMAEASAQLPVGMRLTQVEDQSRAIQEAVDTFLIKFAVALSVVLVVAFATLGIRTGVVVALSVPLTLAIVALFMRGAGIGLERISLGALILSLGLLVDDAIISIEAMVVQLGKGSSRTEAAAYAWSHTAFPMLTGTLLTVISFLPVGFAHSTTSEYAGGIFWVTGAALIFSWIVAVVFVPLLGFKLLPHHVHAASHREAAVGMWLRRAVEWTLVRRVKVVGATVAMIALSLAGTLLVRQQFFPLSDRPELIVDIATTPGTALEKTSEAARQIEAMLLADRDVRHIETHVGGGPPRFYLPYAPAKPMATHATVLLVANDIEARERLIRKLGKYRPGASVNMHVQRLSLGPNDGFPVQYRVLGPDADRLRAIAAQVSDILRATPGAVAVQTDWGSRSPMLTLDADPMRMAQLGTDRANLAGELQAMLSGQPAGETLDGTKRRSIIVRADAADRTDSARWPDLPVSTTSGMVPLREIGRITLGSDFAALWQRNGELCITVQADTATGRQPAEIVTLAKQRIEALRASLPEGYRIEIGGDEELSATANDAIFALLPLTFGAMLLVLMLQLQNLGRALLVLATAPLGLIGAVSALLLTRSPFGFVALLGLIALAGMIMRNTIILVDQTERNRREGMRIREAVIEATVARARPVVLTALAAVLAFIPLAFNIFWGPMAIVMIGGLLGATLLTLLALPAVYLLAFERGAADIKDMKHV